MTWPIDCRTIPEGPIGERLAAIEALAVAPRSYAVEDDHQWHSAVERDDERKTVRRWSVCVLTGDACLWGECSRVLSIDELEAAYGIKRRTDESECCDVADNATSADVATEDHVESIDELIAAAIEHAGQMGWPVPAFRVAKALAVAGHAIVELNGLGNATVIVDDVRWIGVESSRTMARDLRSDVPLMKWLADHRPTHQTVHQTDTISREIKPPPTDVPPLEPVRSGAYAQGSLFG